MDNKSLAEKEPEEVDPQGPSFPSNITYYSALATNLAKQHCPAILDKTVDR